MNPNLWISSLWLLRPNELYDITVMIIKKTWLYEYKYALGAFVHIKSQPPIHILMTEIRLFFWFWGSLVHVHKFKAELRS